MTGEKPSGSPQKHLQLTASEQQPSSELLAALDALAEKISGQKDEAKASSQLLETRLTNLHSESQSFIKRLEARLSDQRVESKRLNQDLQERLSSQYAELLSSQHEESKRLNQDLQERLSLQHAELLSSQRKESQLSIQRLESRLSSQRIVGFLLSSLVLGQAVALYSLSNKKVPEVAKPTGGALLTDAPSRRQDDETKRLADAQKEILARVASVEGVMMARCIPDPPAILQRYIVMQEYDTLNQKVDQYATKISKIDENQNLMSARQEKSYNQLASSIDKIEKTTIDIKYRVEHVARLVNPADK